MSSSRQSDEETPRETEEDRAARHERERIESNERYERDRQEASQKHERERLEERDEEKRRQEGRKESS